MKQQQQPSREYDSYINWFVKILLLPARSSGSLLLLLLLLLPSPI